MEGPIQLGRNTWPVNESVLQSHDGQLGRVSISIMWMVHSHWR